MRYAGTIDRLEDNNAILVLFEEISQEMLELSLPVPTDDVLVSQFNIKPGNEALFFNGEDAETEDGRVSPTIIIFRIWP